MYMYMYMVVNGNGKPLHALHKLAISLVLALKTPRTSVRLVVTTKVFREAHSCDGTIAAVAGFVVGALKLSYDDVSRQLKVAVSLPRQEAPR